MTRYGRELEKISEWLDNIPGDEIALMDISRTEMETVIAAINILRRESIVVRGETIEDRILTEIEGRRAMRARGVDPDEVDDEIPDGYLLDGSRDPYS